MMSNIHTNISEWMKMSEETPVIISSRIRLARNLENHVHPLMFPSEQEGYRVINEVQDALPNLTLNRLDTMDQQSKMKLVAKHLVSPELVKQPELHKQLIVLDLQFEVYTEKGHMYMVTFIRFQTNLH